MQKKAQEGTNGLRCNWSGPAFWCRYTSQSRRSGPLQGLQSRYHSAQQQRIRAHSPCELQIQRPAVHGLMHYAPAAAAKQPHHYKQELHSSLPADNQLVGGVFKCIAGQQDILDPARHRGQRTQGYWTGLRRIEMDHQLYDVWQDLHPSRHAFTHKGTSDQSTGRLDRWLILEPLRAGVSRKPLGGLPRRPPFFFFFFKGEPPLLHRCQSHASQHACNRICGDM